MLILCQACGANTDVELGDEPVRFNCCGCRQEYSLCCVGDTGPATRQRLQAPARSSAHETDLASILAEPVDVMRPVGADAPIVVHYDPGFEGAISEGLMTVLQAMQLGARLPFASTIAQKHGLPMDLALDVVDKRRSVSEAIEQNKKLIRLESERTRERWVRTAFTWAVRLGFAALLVLGVFLFSRPRERTPDRPKSITLEESRQILKGGDTIPAKILTDAAGQVTQVTGADPLSVLAAYCESRPAADSPIVPVEVVRASPDANARLVGVFRDRDEAAVRRGIVIRKDQSTHRWIAGNGMRPVALIDTPNLPRR